MIEGRVLPWIIDNSIYKIWDNLDIVNRDLIFLDRDGNFYRKMNLTDSDLTEASNEIDVINTIIELLNNN